MLAARAAERVVQFNHLTFDLTIDCLELLNFINHLFRAFSPFEFNSRPRLLPSVVPNFDTNEVHPAARRRAGAHVGAKSRKNGKIIIC